MSCAMFEESLGVFAGQITQTATQPWKKLQIEFNCQSAY